MAVNLNNLVRLTKAQVRPVAEMMARAFQDDPGSVYFFPDVSERKNKLPYIFQLMIRYGLLYGEAYATSPNLEGAAVWLPSEKVPRTLWGNIRSGSLSRLFKVGRKTAAKEKTLGEYVSSIRERHAPSTYWYLLLLGVDPVSQGKGYASILLRAMFARIDQERLPCYLETLTEKDVSIYQRHGFKVVEEGKVPGSEVTIRAMLREG
jgi:ribosomal protein S18 acetylase RimI-like enzyme